MTALQIRTLTADDWAVWREVRLRALADAPKAFGSTLADWTGENDVEVRWRSRFDNVEFNAVAVIDDVVVGAVGGIVTADRPEAELISMWVAPEVRGAGVGIRLIDSVVDWARGLSIGHLTIAVRRDNHRAVALYERAGFELTGPNPSDPTENLMAVDLTGSTASGGPVVSAL